MRNNTIVLVLTLLLAAAAIYLSLPIDHFSWLEQRLGTEGAPRDLRIPRLGLDLQGGTQVLLEADLAEGQELEAGDMDTAQMIVENRVNGLGVSESVVQQQGGNRLIVELPGVNNPDQAVQTIRSTGQLEFVPSMGANLVDGMVINTTKRPDAAARIQAQIDAGEVDPATVSIPYPDRVFETAMTGDVIDTAQVTVDRGGQPLVSFVTTSEGAKQFQAFTSANIGNTMAIVLDGVVLSNPVIQGNISTEGQITGQFTQDEADSLAVQLRYGSLPVALSVEEVRTIGASLGQESVNSSLIAGILGMIGVLLFMLIIYRLPGLLANVALLFYIAFNIAIFKLIPVTLTLAGIAGFILSIGMAVDANILIFERMKEELREGRSIRAAVEAGFSRAWPAIRDGNLSTLISCAVLFWFGNQFGASIVQGFAVTLGIGVLLSMFTAVFVTRTFMRAFLATGGQAMREAHGLLGY